MSCIGKHVLKMSLQRVLGNNASLRYRNNAWTRGHGTGYEADGKTSVQILNQEADVGLMVDSYSQMGFRLNNGMVVIGPIALFPRSVLSWNVGSHQDIDETSLLLFSLLTPKLDLLVIGVGEDTRDLRLNRAMVAFSRSSKINVEILPTDRACATFNFLNAEGRYVAAAMIPPDTLRHTDDDVIVSKLRQKKLYGPEEGEEPSPFKGGQLK